LQLDARGVSGVRSLIALFYRFLVIFAVFILLGVLIGASPEWALYGAAALGLYSLLACIRPYKPSWLGGGLTSIALLFIAAIAAAVSLEFSSFQRQQVAEQNELRLQALRSSDPKAYLAELKAANGSRWETELKALDKPEYDALIAERHRKEVDATKEQISSVLAQLAKTPTSDVDTLHSLYLRLSLLDPSNASYAKKRDSFAIQLADLQAKELEEKEKFTHPENLVSIENFSWTKEGFGNVMEANFVIRNKLPWPVKDLEVRCDHSAPSGTLIDSNTRTIYERIEANQTKRIYKFNMGFIHSQATRSGCRIVSVVSIR
jgi:hypothetical protein